MNENKKIEQLIKEKLEKGSIKTMSQPQWPLIASKINTAPKSTLSKKRIWISWSIAASLAIITLSGWLFWNTNPSSEVNLQATNHQPLPVPLNTETISQMEKADTSMPLNNATSTKSPSSNTAPYSPQNLAQQINTITDSNVVFLDPSNKNEISSQLSITSEQENDHPEELITNNSNSNSSFNLTEENKNKHLKHIHKTESKPFTLGVSGAVNYGNQNSGYVVALSARQDLGQRFFVDGSVSMVYNNTSGEVVGLPTNMKKADLLSPVPVQNAIQREVVNYIPAVNTLYLQINPKIGYKIIEEIAISMGPDFQKLMNENHYSGFNYYALSDHGVFSQLPSIDVGFTAQTEVDLSKNLKAGLLYRQGINNILKTQPNMYINRNYLQFQLKYSIGF